MTMSLTYLYVYPNHWSIPSILIQLTQEDPNIDPELNKYPPLLAYGLDVVASATKLITGPVFQNILRTADLTEVRFSAQART